MVKYKHELKFGIKDKQAINDVLKLQAHMIGVPKSLIICFDVQIFHKWGFRQLRLFGGL
jgi:hypothetical protein